MGRKYRIQAAVGAAVTTNRVDRMEYDVSGNVVRTVSEFQDGRLAESTTAYDMLNRAVSATDVLGNTRTTGYDGLGRTVFTGGDAYPLMTGCDTSGRKTTSETTRAGGETWDETRWNFDPASGLNTAKEFADGSRIAYAYTDNGKKTRTTWSRDRGGRRTLRSARTGSDDLYRADEDVWLADVSTNGAFRVTRHFFDGLGRETNAVVCAGATPGEAATPTGGTYAAASAVATVYSGNGESETVDARGKTMSRSSYADESYEYACETLSTNGVPVSSVSVCSYRNGGREVERRWGGEWFWNWRREIRRREYRPDGCAVDLVLADSSDAPWIVTNSATFYDPLGRVAVASTPFSRVTNVYDGVSSRLLSSTDTKSGVTTVFLYDALGEQIGTTVNGVTNTGVTAYEQISNAVWKVVTDSVVGPSTNSWTVTRTRLTGLNAACRSEAIVERSPGGVTHTCVTDDPDTGIRTETSDSSLTGERTVESWYGIELVSHEPSGVTTNSYDAFGRCVRTAKGDVVREYDYDSVGALIAKRTLTATNALVETYSYDMLGQKVEVTDALGQSTYTSYDAVGNVVAEWGATYPVRSEYDTAGRRTALLTTRDGVLWDRTSWTYDPATGLCLRKTYADGTFEAYSYTDDGLLTATTRPGGQVLTNVYDANRKLVRTSSNDGALDYVYARDEYGRIVTASNAVARTACVLHNSGIATNEYWTVGTNTAVITRSVDSVGRMDGLVVVGTGYAQQFAYTSDDLIGTISNTDAVVTYTYAADRNETGCVLSLTNGMTFVRSVTRDPSRRELVTEVTTTVNGSTVESFGYDYDADGRPVARNADGFGYNVRGEVASATVNGALFAYGYDEIGNSTNWMANCLNQYTHCTYDADGNMTQCGPWTYAYDSMNRLETVSSNGVLLVTNSYDAKSHRVRKVTAEATTTFFYDDWNLVEEQIAYANGISSTIRYYWGKDLSGTLQGSGGVGGLLYLTMDSAIYIPCYDNNGNITRYLNANGVTVAQYLYDAFGRTISKTGPIADVFRHHFSSKYYDEETKLYYYGERFYHPVLMRWLNRDPIEEAGGENLYAFCANLPTCLFDRLGLACKVGSYNVLRLDVWEKPWGNGTTSNPDFFNDGGALLSSIDTLGNLMSLSSISASSLANFQSFVDTMVGKGISPNADALVQLRKLYDRLRTGPLTVNGILEYEVCICKGKKSSFVKQGPIRSQDEVLDGSDQMELQRVRRQVLKSIVNDMFSRIRGMN